MKNIRLFITITAILLYTRIPNATATPSSDIATLEMSLLSYTRDELQNCAQKQDMDCNIKLALHNLSDRNKLNDEPGTINYYKAEQLLTPFTGRSAIARYLIAEIRINQRKIIEAKALLSSAGIEGFPPALDRLSNELDDVYMYTSDKNKKIENLKWQYRYYKLRPDTDIAYNIAVHFMNQDNKDCPSALYWLAEAVSGQNASTWAQEYLGGLYEAGNCVPQNYVLAYMMYDLGGALPEKTQALEKKMTSEQIQEGTLRSYLWQEENDSYRFGYSEGL